MLFAGCCFQFFFLVGIGRIFLCFFYLCSAWRKSANSFWSWCLAFVFFEQSLDFQETTNVLFIFMCPFFGAVSTAWKQHVKNSIENAIRVLRFSFFSISNLIFWTFFFISHLFFCSLFKLRWTTGCTWQKCLSNCVPKSFQTHFTFCALAQVEWNYEIPLKFKTYNSCLEWIHRW